LQLVKENLSKNDNYFEGEILGKSLYRAQLRLLASVLHLAMGRSRVLVMETRFLLEQNGYPSGA
jgi:hypothetical protein